MSFDYGRDVWCTDSLRTGRYATGLRVVAQTALHRLTTPRSALRGGEEEADFGIDLPGMIGSTQTEVDAAALPGRIRTELKKDRRIQDAQSTLTQSTDAAGGITWTIEIRVVTELGTFTLQASAVTVTIVGLGGST